MVDVTELQIKMKKIAVIDTQIAELKNKRETLNEYIKKNCPHPTVTREEEYVSGTYLDRAYTITTVKCTLCDTVIDQDTKTHSWYG